MAQPMKIAADNRSCVSGCIRLAAVKTLFSARSMALRICLLARLSKLRRSFHCSIGRTAVGDSLDHLVGGRNKIGWKRKPKGAGSTKIDDEIVSRDGEDGKMARVGSTKDTIDVASS